MYQSVRSPLPRGCSVPGALQRGRPEEPGAGCGGPGTDTDPSKARSAGGMAVVPGFKAALSGTPTPAQPPPAPPLLRDHPRGGGPGTAGREDGDPGGVGAALTASLFLSSSDPPTYNHPPPPSPPLASPARLLPRSERGQPEPLSACSQRTLI